MEAIGLDNRDAIAFIFVTALGLVLAIWGETRGSVRGMVRKALSGSMGCIVLAFTLVALGLLIGAYLGGWWRAALLTPTLLWFVGFLRVGLFDVAHLSTGVMRFRALFRGLLAGPTIFTFVTGIYTYSLVVELALYTLVLLAVTLRATATIAAPKATHESNCIVTGATIVIVAVSLLTTLRVVVGLLTDGGDVDWQGVLAEFLWPVALTVLTAPVVYVAAVWANVETAQKHLGWQRTKQRRRQGVTALLLESHGQLSVLTRRSQRKRIRCYHAMADATTVGEARAIFRKRMRRRGGDAA
jgi:hypothetical protein